MKGQTTIQMAVNIGGIVAAILVSYFGSQLNINDKISTSQAQVMTEISSDRERISRLEEAITTIKGDNEEIKSDVKEILKTVK